jgi:hypothetical protein
MMEGGLYGADLFSNDVEFLLSILVWPSKIFSSLSYLLRGSVHKHAVHAGRTKLLCGQR